MNDWHLRELLTEADASISEPLQSANLALAVRQRFARQRRRRHVGLAAACVLIAATSFGLWQTRGAALPVTANASRANEATQQTPVASADTIERLRAELELLDARADAQAQIARLLAARAECDQAESRWHALRADGDPRQMLARDIEAAATAALIAAVRDSHQGESPSETQASLERIVQVFPSTGAAVVAQRRLADSDMIERMP